MSTKWAFSTLSSPRLDCSATLSRTVPSSSRQYRSRPRLSNISCPGVMHRSAAEQAPVCLSPWAPSCVHQSCSAPCWIVSRRVEPLAGARRPLCSSWPRYRPEIVLTQATRRCGKLLDLRRWRGQRHSFPRRRAGGESFILFRRWLKSQRYPHCQRKSKFPFLRVFRLAGWQCATHCLLTLARDPSCQCTNPKASRAPWGWGLTPHGVLPPPMRWRTAPLWQTSVELRAGRHRTPSRDSTVSALSQFLPVCWVTGKWQEELAGVTLAAPFPLTRGYERLFSPPVQFPGWRTLVEFLQHPRQSDWAEQSDARPSTCASSPGSPVSPCTRLGVRMAWFPSGNPIRVFVHGKVSLTVNPCLPFDRALCQALLAALLPTPR